ncbi:MAG: hypothetical protein IPH06_02980 [Alphaproteobacteria bacterium]|jgi:hypothetical protein|nr:hypothetical protein [Alphaproteobacteria bacterium]QQS57007.1 MAG: hypothetical protein IPN28_12235 [Alphaproteobacteria bacterium]
MVKVSFFTGETGTNTDVISVARAFEGSASYVFPPSSFQEVESRNGILSGREAMNFVNKVLYSYQDVETGRQALADLSLETRLNLYDAIANDKQYEFHGIIPVEVDIPGRVEALDALGLSKGAFTKELVISQEREVDAFFSADNEGNLQRQWEEAGYGYRFKDILKEGVHNRLDSNQQKAVLAFIIDSYSRQLGVKRSGDIVFSENSPNSSVHLTSSGEEFLGMEVGMQGGRDSFLNSIDSVMHELEHMRQATLAARYAKGEISRTDPRYLEARLYAASTSVRGFYISPDEGGFQAYQAQPIEVGARWVGAYAASRVAILCERDTDDILWRGSNGHFWSAKGSEREEHFSL